MFIWDFVADTILGQIVDWIYGQVMGFLGNFFAEMGNMGVELFELSWVQSIVLFFSYLAWALYVTGLVVACFECGIEYSSGRGNLKETALCAIKGFMAVSLFTVVPIRLYELSVTLQASLTAGITGYGTSIGEAATEIVNSLSGIDSLTGMTTGSYFGFASITSPIMLLFCIILMAYAVIKVFFANLKRGGILLIQIAVGSLYMFSVPRGYTDGFIQWCKQIIGLCLTAFLQSTILIAGLMVFKDHALLGLGLMLSAGGAVSLALLNKYIQFSATSRGLTREENSLCYKWRLGNIYYTKCGSGKPLLLIHDLHFASSGYEWESIREQLSRSYTVYTLDLLGCGRSEKPNLTYTNYLFVQLICDFIKSEIGHRTNILSTGDSAALSIMACSNSPELFDQIMLINPSSLTDCCQLPGKNAKLYKLLLDLPLAGTLIYHIACSRSMIEEAFRTKYFYNPYTVKPVQIDRSHEAAHLGECPKAIFSSIECRYTKCNISNALRKIDNSIFIIGGSEEPMIEATIQDYKIYNSAIESSIIPKTKHLPQLEQPDAVMDAIHMFFS